MPGRCLYDNAKVVVPGRDADGRPEWDQRMLDMPLRMGFDLRVCQPYRAQTKGKAESGVKYVRGNLWPSVRFTDDADLNRQSLEWCDSVANRRMHGTTARRPWEMLAEEAGPSRRAAGAFRRWRCICGMAAGWRMTAMCSGRAPATACRGGGQERTVRVGQRVGTVEIWAGEQRLAVHRRADPSRAALPSRSASGKGCRGEVSARGQEALAVQVAVEEVDRRSLDVYELAAAGGVR